MKTLKRWFLLAILKVAVSLVLFNLAPHFINGNYPWIGFAMDGAILLFWVLAFIRISYCLVAANELKLLLSAYKVRSSWLQRLDIVTTHNIDVLPQTLEIISKDLDVFPCIIDFLLSKK